MAADFKPEKLGLPQHACWALGTSLPQEERRLLLLLSSSPSTEKLPTFSGIPPHWARGAGSWMFLRFGSLVIPDFFFSCNQADFPAPVSRLVSQAREAVGETVAPVLPPDNGLPTPGM